MYHCFNCIGAYQSLMFDVAQLNIGTDACVHVHMCALPSLGSMQW